MVGIVGWQQAFSPQTGRFRKIKLACDIRHREKTAGEVFTSRGEPGNFLECSYIWSYNDI